MTTTERQEDNRQPYQAPQLSPLGSLRQLTAAGSGESPEANGPTCRQVRFDSRSCR